MPEKLGDEALDSSECRAEDLKKMVEIALSCTQSPSSRPSMSQILAMLLSDRSMGVVRPSLNYGIKVAGENSSVSTGSSATNATASFTHFTGR